MTPTYMAPQRHVTDRKLYLFFHYSPARPPAPCRHLDLPLRCPRASSCFQYVWTVWEDTLILFLDRPEPIVTEDGVLVQELCRLLKEI
jgi:hypothetical protein